MKYETHLLMLMWVNSFCNYENDLPFFFSSFVFLPHPSSQVLPVCLSLSWLALPLLCLQFAYALFLIMCQSNIYAERPMTPWGLLGFYHLFCFVTQTHAQKFTETGPGKDPCYSDNTHTSLSLTGWFAAITDLIEMIIFFFFHFHLILVMC